MPKYRNDSVETSYMVKTINGGFKPIPPGETVETYDALTEPTWTLISDEPYLEEYINACSGETVVGDYPSDPMPCQGKRNLVLKSDYNISNSEVDIRFAYFDNGKRMIGYSDILTIANTAVLNGSRYEGVATILTNDSNAHFFKVRIENTPTNGGNVTIDAAAVKEV